MTELYSSMVGWLLVMPSTIRVRVESDGGGGDDDETDDVLIRAF